VTVVVGTDRLAAVLVADGLAASLVRAEQRGAPGHHRVRAAQRATGPSRSRPGYWPLSLALLTGLHGLFLAGDLFTAYLMLEVVAVAGAVLVAFGGGRVRLAAGTRYFYAELVASVTFLSARRSCGRWPGPS
jgi:multicomponent Na+:H+ antiporter subunit D